MGPKTGLRSKEVAKDHFSSGTRKKDNVSKLVVKILEGSSLLASDLSTGKSDPICFLRVGLPNEDPNLRADDSRVFMTSVCNTTTDPIWNEDIPIPMSTFEIAKFSELHLLIVVRDEDKTDDQISYDELGMVDIPILDVLTSGIQMKNAIVLKAKKYELIKYPGMKRVDGVIKLSISLQFFMDDCQQLISQLGDGITTTDDIIAQLKSQYCPKPATVPSRPTSANLNSRPKSGSLKASAVEAVECIQEGDVEEPEGEAAADAAFGIPGIDPNEETSKETSQPEFDNNLIPLSGDMGETSIQQLLDQLQGLQKRMFDAEAKIAEKAAELEPISLPIVKLQYKSDNEASPRTELLTEAPAQTSTHQPEVSGVQTDGVDIQQLNEALESSNDHSRIEASTKQLQEIIGESELANIRGNAAATVRSLRDISRQRDLMEKQLQELIRLTSHGFQQLTDRVNRVEQMTEAAIQPEQQSAGHALHKQQLLPTGPAASASSASSVVSAGGSAAPAAVPASKKPVSTARNSALKAFKKQARDKLSCTLPTQGNAELAVELVYKANNMVKSVVMPPHDSASAAGNIELTNYQTPGTGTTSEGSGTQQPQSSPSKVPKIVNGGNACVHWSQLQAWLDIQDYASCYCEVLDRGNLQDLAQLLEITGPKPEILSTSLRNRVYDCIATMLSQDMHVERCLIWVLAVVRGQDHMAQSLVRHTCRDLVEALEITAAEQSKRGMLASLLASQLNKILTKGRKNLNSTI